MSTSFASNTNTVLKAVEKLFDEKPPVLVEVRFPKMGAASDWCLCENAAALDAILDRLGPGEVGCVKRTRADAPRSCKGKVRLREYA